MKFATALSAPEPKSSAMQKIAWLYAASLTVMAVGQLFSFEDFIPLIEGYRLPGGVGTATMVAAVIVISEVFALPFLLRMSLSPLMRWISLGFALVVPAAWTKLAIWALVTENALVNSGMLGTKVTVPVGLISLAISLTLLVLAAWSVWGLWPVHTRKK